MGVVNPHNLSLLLKIERREQEAVLKDFWDDYNKQHKQIISSWMRMSEEHDSFVLHKLFQQLQPLGEYNLTLKICLRNSDIPRDSSILQYPSF